MKFKLIVLVLISLATNAFAGSWGSKGSWESDLKLKNKTYSCENKKEFYGVMSGGTGDYTTTNLFICLNPSNSNQALWLIETSNRTITNCEEEVFEASTEYYENCKLSNDEWDCEKKEVLSRTENLLDNSLKLENETEFDPNEMRYIKDNKDWLDFSSEEFCKNFSVEQFQQALKEQNIKDLEADLDGKGFTQLMCAAFNQDLTMAEKLIKSGANVNAETSCGHKVLRFAVRNPNPEMVKLLLKNGADVNAISETYECSCYVGGGEPVILDAIRNGTPEVAITLIEAGADVNFGEDSNEALYIANSQANLPLFKALLKAGAKLKKGQGAFSKDLEITKLLVEQGADVNHNSYNNSPLISATNDSNLELMDYLLKAGAEINLQTTDGTTALMAAKEPKIVDFLIKSGADINLINNKGNTVLLHLINHLLKYGQYTVEKDEYLEKIKTILKFNPNVDIQNNGWNALMLIVRNEKKYLSTQEVVELIKLIIRQKPKLYLSDNNKWTALHLAARYQNAQIVKLLLDAGADLEQKTQDNDTALILAVFNENNALEVAKVLLEAGADLNAKDIAGKTALDYAKERKNFELTTALLEMQNEQ